VSELLQYFITGISVGAIYALVALGFNIIYNATEVINFAQGEFLVLGAFFAATFLGVFMGVFHWSSVQVVGGLDEIMVHPYSWWSMLLAAVLATACVTGIGALMYLGAIFPVKGASVLRLVMITIALSFMFQGLAMLVWGKDELRYHGFSEKVEVQASVQKVKTGPPAAPGPARPKAAPVKKASLDVGGGIKFLGATIIPQYLWVLGVTLVIVIFMTFFFERTMVGKAMSACADNPLAASLVGINVNRMVMLSFALSAFLGAVGGLVFLGPIGVQYDSGPLNAIKGFAAAIFGGLGSFWGAVAGGCLLGLVEAFWKGYIGSTYAEASSMLVLLAVLFLRPSGLFGSVEAAKIKKF
jgi:branched-chain amino acid transport system permease protein